MRGSGSPSKVERRALTRRQRKALAVRESLFEAGLEAFGRQPIGLVSILDITEAADVAKGVFYLQFKSKDEYLLALWEEIQKRLLEAISVRTAKITSKRERTFLVVDEFHRFSIGTPSAGRFWIRMASYFPDEVGRPDALESLLERYYTALAGELSGRARSAVSASDLAKARALDSLCWALIRLELFHEGRAFQNERLRRAVSSALTVLGEKGDGSKRPINGGSSR